MGRQVECRPTQGLIRFSRGGIVRRCRQSGFRGVHRTLLGDFLGLGRLPGLVSLLSRPGGNRLRLFRSPSRLLRLAAFRIEADGEPTPIIIGQIDNGPSGQKWLGKILGSLKHSHILEDAGVSILAEVGQTAIGGETALAEFVTSAEVRAVRSVAVASATED